jgi:hypothetical protein
VPGSGTARATCSGSASPCADGAVQNRCVIDSRTAKRITLADLFSDEQAGLQWLSEQTKLGFAPTEANFAHWIHPAETEATVVIRLW